MKLMKTISLGWIGLSMLLLAPGAWAQSAGAGGEAGETAAPGGAPGAEPSAGAPAEPVAGASGAEAGGAGGAAEGGAGGQPEPVVPPANKYDLLDNDGGRGCSIGRAGAPDGLAAVLAAALGASLLRRRKRD